MFKDLPLLLLKKTQLYICYKAGPAYEMKFQVYKRIKEADWTLNSVFYQDVPMTTSGPHKQLLAFMVLPD